jgi:ABC-type lipoprotein release transport system permease subunit
MSDLALGVRLAVGGGRTSLARFALSTFGIAVAVAVLLVGASVGTMVEGFQTRESANAIGENKPVPGVDPVYVQSGVTEFRGETIDARYVYAEGADHPVPNGMHALPGPDEVVVSPALADLLRSPEGELLRPRFPGRIAEVLDTSVVPEPGDLIAYVGADRGLVDKPNAMPVYEFGDEGARFVLPPEVLVLVLAGAVVLLLPVFIFVASASRIAGAERDRRLSALRLVGSGSRQVRRIAAAESLVSALAGLVLGITAFLVLRQFSEDVTLFGLRVYESDVVPDPVLVVLIVLAIPALAVLTALFALRRTIIEPLGVVRYAKPVRRRLWWRVALVVAGVALLLTQAGLSKSSGLWPVVVSAGAALLLLGVPVLLPWLVERVAGRIHGGPSSWQLAIRRLQLDSGTSARVVGGVAVVLAGAVTLQTVLMTAQGDVGVGEEVEPAVEVSVSEAIVDDVVADLGSVAAVRDTSVVRNAQGYRPDTDPATGSSYFISVMDCETAEQLVGIRGCADGQVWALEGRAPTPKPGERLEFREYEQQGTEVDPSRYTTVDSWTVPDDLRHVPFSENMRVYVDLVVTPGALGSVRLPRDDAIVHAPVGDISSDDLERLRNAVAEYGPDIYVHSSGTGQDLSKGQQIFVAVRQALYAGSIFTLLLAGVSLLVLALEHIRERRRPLAVLAATGVPRGVLARSLLWQVALPIGLGVLVAVLTGVGLAWLVVRLSNDPLFIDWAGVGLLAAGAALLALLVTAMTLPFLRSATRLTSLRTE